MKPLDVYIKCLILRYRETGNVTNSLGLVKRILELNNKEENKTHGDEEENIESFKSFVMVYNDNPSKYTLKTLIENVRMNLVGMVDVSNNVVEMLKDKNYTNEDTEALKAELLKFLKVRELYTTLLDALRCINQGKEVNDTNIINTLKDIKSAEANKENADVVLLDDEEGVGNLAEKAVELNSEAARFKSGFAKLNRALDGGFRRGEFAMVGALRYNYKSGILRTLFLQMAFHNTPIVQEGKIPAVMYIGFEDLAATNLKFCYDYLYCNEHGVAPSKDVTATEMKEFVNNKMKDAKFKCIMARANPEEYSLSKILGFIDKYTDMGYDIQVCCIDYLSKITPKGATGESSEAKLKSLYQDAYEEISKKRNILTITAHQLNTMSRDLAYGGADPKDFVKSLPGRGATENCKSLDQILDIEMYCHVYTDKVTNKSHLAVQIGKHRMSPTTPEQHKYFTVTFIPNGTLIENDKANADGALMDEDMMLI